MKKIMTNKYHFSLHLQFKQDCDVDKVEKFLDVTAYRKNLLKDSLGENKTAKIWIKTKDFINPDTYDVLHNFIENFLPKFEKIKGLIEEYDGKATFTLYFEEFKEKPYIRLDARDMEIFSDNHINFEVDFRY